ncbi:MAG: 50S ribosomal protein L17 [Ignavibacteriae bacterium]|nr:50S ribosomal protein L17 [Ignavibacteriota bacterium]
MRHRIKGRKLGRSTSHRLATLRSLATALIKHKKIKTTLAKAKQTRLFAEPIITKAKKGSVHARRLVSRDIQDRQVLQELFGEVVEKIGDRPGGYTRVIKLGARQGDAAEMAIIELVDYNDGGEVRASKKSKAKKETSKEVEKKVVEEVVEAVEEEEVIEENNETESVEEVKVESDDLKKIEGIGPKISDILNNNGIFTFSDLAGSDNEKISKMLSDAGGRFASHNPETWAAQAKMAADGKWDELKKWQDELDGGLDKS